MKMKKKTSKTAYRRVLAILLSFVLAFSNVEVFANANTESDNETTNIEAVAATPTIGNGFTGVITNVEPPTSYTEVYNRIIAFKELLPDGTPWDDDTPYGKNGPFNKNGYVWKGGLIDNAVANNFGCAALGAQLSDGAFGNLPAKKLNKGSFTFEQIRVGDILRINNNSHSVIVLQTNSAGVIVAEGNLSGKVHWGRAISKQDVMYADFILTRYPAGFVSDDEEDAKSIVDSGKEGNFTWTLTKAGILTISGTGAMSNYSFNDDIMPSWSKTEHNISSIVLSSGITSIGDFAFYNSSALSVSIPNTVTKIGDYAFYGSKLIGVSIPGSVATIGNYAFRACKSLGSLTFAEGTKTIGDYAFCECTAISGILNIPASVTSVGDSAFQSCGELMSVQFTASSNPVTIGNYAFTRCWKMLSIKLPETLTAISNGLFTGCTVLTYLSIPASVKEISIKDGQVGRDSPFASTALQQIDFAGTDATWNAIGGAQALKEAYLGNVTVNCIQPGVTPTSTPTPVVTPTPIPTPNPTPTAEPMAIPSVARLFSDYKYTNLVSTCPTIYGNGGTFKTGTVKTTNKQFTAYTDILASYKYTLNSKGIVKPAAGKVIVGITSSNTKPAVTKNKIIDTAAAKIARAKIKNGQITVTATGRERGLVYLWIIDTGDKGVSECCPVNVLLAPKKLEVQDTSGSKIKNPKLQNGETLNVCVAGILTGNKRTDDCTYAVTVEDNSQSYISVSPSGGNQFTITAKGLKNNKNTKAVVVCKCNENGKQLKFTLTITP